MSPLLYLAQRGTAAILAVTVAVHLGTIVYAVRGGLTAGEILGRTQGNLAFLLFYAVFVLAAAIHAPIGLRSVLREWAGWRGRSLDVAMDDHRKDPAFEMPGIGPAGELHFLGLLGILAVGRAEVGIAAVGADHPVDHQLHRRGRMIPIDRSDQHDAVRPHP